MSSIRARTHLSCCVCQCSIWALFPQQACSLSCDLQDPSTVALPGAWLCFATGCVSVCKCVWGCANVCVRVQPLICNQTFHMLRDLPVCAPWHTRRVRDYQQPFISSRLSWQLIWQLRRKFYICCRFIRISALIGFSNFDSLHPHLLCICLKY